MSDLPWPAAPPPTPPIADYPLRLHDSEARPEATLVAPAVVKPPPALPSPAPSSPPPSGTRVKAPSDRRTTRTAVLASVAVLLVFAIAATAFALARQPDTTPTASPPTSAASPHPSTTSTTRQSRRAPPTTAQDPSVLIPNFPNLPDLTIPTVPKGPKASDDQIKAEVDTLKSFVERDRGLTFKGPVEVTVMSASAFKQRVLDEFAKEADLLARQGRLFTGLGILDSTIDPATAQAALLGDGVLGFYDPATKVLVVKGQHITPFWREIVVHELTHALDDQNVGLDRPDVSARTDGSDWAYAALTEGSARRVENDYVASLSPADTQTLQSEMLTLGMEQLGALMSGSLALALILQAPYDFGEPFVRSLVAKGGNEAVTKAFSDLPTTAEQILHPDRYARREAAKPVDVPPADGTAIDNGVVGEYLTGLMLQGGSGLGNLDDLINKMLSGEIDPNNLQQQLTAIPTPAGWGGDRYVTWAKGSTTCIRVDWKWDSDADRRAFATTAKTWAATDGKAKIESPATDTVRLTRCA